VEAGALEGYRVLDLTEGGCLICGRILADLGADVIKVEKPGGSPSRNIGPFYKDDIHSEKSLFWFVYNAGKKSITLDIETKDGQEIFKKLTKSADFIVESFPPEYMSNLQLGYDILSQVNRRIILTSITPWGRGGPYGHYKASDLVVWSMAGFSYVIGDSDRPPLGPTVSLAYYTAGTVAASASLIAHWGRELTGEGERVEILMRECILDLVAVIYQWWDLERFIQVRGGEHWIWPGNVRMRVIFSCKDGHVYCHIWGGSDAALISSNKALLKWMDEEGMAPEWLTSFDWVHDFSSEKMTDELAQRVHKPFEEFFMTKTKQELYRRAVKDRIILAPVNSVKEILEDPQLGHRGFWQKIEHPETSDVFLYPNYPVRMSGTPARIHGLAPRIGQDNNDIYQNELGFSKADLVLLKQAKII
jgi:benzylsuccinate CoA-transferase BbsE subunit